MTLNYLGTYFMREYNQSYSVKIEAMMKIIDFAYAVDTALMQGVKKFFNMQQVFLFLCYGFQCRNTFHVFRVQN